MPLRVPSLETTVRRGVTRGSVVGSVLVLVAALAGSAAFVDNSFFTHLATGKRMLDGSFPSVDPYSYTAMGRPWVIQSWFASLLYGLTYQIGHGLGTRLLIAGLSALLALLLWRLTNDVKSLIARFLACVPALLVGMANWGPRPLLFGLIGIVAMLIVLREERDPRWMIPVMWVWVNTHGSFPMALVLVALYGIGRKLDEAPLEHTVRAAKWTVVGILIGGINPIGPKILWFPIELLSKQQALSVMIEWQAPSFQSNWQRVFLLGVVASALLAPRIDKTRRYQLLLPALLFSAMGFVAMRNIAVATLLLAPVLANGIGNVGTIGSSKRAPAYTFACIGLAVATILLVVARLSGPAFDFSGYPTTAVTWLQTNGRFAAPHRVATQDIVGNYLELRFGGEVPVFVDDRVDMFPLSIVDDELALVRARSTWGEVLDRWRIDTVLWEKDLPLATVLAASPDWRRVQWATDQYAAKHWVIYERVNRRGR